VPGDDGSAGLGSPGDLGASGVERSRRPRHGRRRLGYRLLIGAGTVVILAVIGWQINATVWTAHSERVGKALIHQVRVKQASDGAATCATATAGGPQGLLEVPAIGLVAPVEEGTGDAVLSVAVGHDPNSAWPGATGNAVLEAHDVSYFVNIDQLKPGDTVRYVTPCATYVFAVQSHHVVAQGSAVYNTATPTVTMVTCWPTDALWFTPDRYLVSATEVQVQRTSPRNLTVPGSPGASAAPAVPAPPALVAQGLTLASYSVPMGTMTIVGDPSSKWVESPAPLADQDSAVESFIAGIRATTENHPSWWHDLAPGVTEPAVLVGADNPSYLSALDVIVTATDDHATAVQLTTTVAITGGSAPGRYALSVEDTVAGGRLVIADWTLRAQ